MKEIIGAQGEVTIFRISAIPEDIAPAKVQNTDKGWIISHSERGHHHILTGGEVMERTKGVPVGMRILYAIVKEPSSFIQDALVPHEAHDLPAGLYEFRIAREFDPFAEQVRQVQD